MGAVLARILVPGKFGKFGKFDLPVRAYPIPGEG
jgi:hypothetical protein